MQITLTLLILLVAIILFATEWIRMDLISLMVLLAVALTGLVTPEEAFLRLCKRPFRLGGKTGHHHRVACLYVVKRFIRI
jgi:di/tricarboxylate transporter